MTTETLVKDGQTLVLGGIYVIDRSDTGTAVPFLSKLPFSGALFRSTKIKDDRKELLIFVSPRGRALTRQALWQVVLRAARRAGSLAQTRYDAGYVNYFEVIDAQRTVLSAERMPELRRPFLLGCVAVLNDDHPTALGSRTMWTRRKSCPRRRLKRNGFDAEPHAVFEESTITEKSLETWFSSACPTGLDLLPAPIAGSRRTSFRAATASSAPPPRQRPPPKRTHALPPAVPPPVPRGRARQPARGATLPPPRP